MAAAPTHSRRVDWVDHAKGFCIVFVVMMHATLGVEKAAGAEGWMHALVQFAKPFRMPDFFMVSGLFLGLVIARPWLRFLDRRVVHFLYFYVLWMTIQFAFKAPGWMADGMSPAGVAGEWLYAFVQPFGTLWFIYLLPVFAVVTRLLRPVPWWLTLCIAALLEMLPVHSGWMVIDEFAARYVYFLAGYLFATRIFELADWASANRGRAAGLLGAWALANGVATFAPAGLLLAPEQIAALGPETQFVSDLPLVSLVLGAAGAVAVILLTALLSTLRWTDFLAWLGRHSIVVYLAFFLPMAASRAVLLKFAPFLDIGTVSLLVTAAGVTGPVVLHFLIRWTGYGTFLFERPLWARIDREGAAAPAPRLSPAE